MSEQQLQSKIIKYIFGKGGYAVKVVVATKAGIPDIIACLDGKFIGLEVKTEKGVASPLQFANIELIKAAGGRAAIVRSLEDAMEVLNDI